MEVGIFFELVVIPDDTLLKTLELLSPAVKLKVATELERSRLDVIPLRRLEGLRNDEEGRKATLDVLNIDEL